MNQFILLSASLIISITSIAQNVGIGTSSPVTKLSVLGGFRVSSEYITASQPPTADQTITLTNGSLLAMGPDTVRRVYDPGGTGNYLPSQTAGFRVSENGILSSNVELLIENIELGTGDSLLIYDGTTTTYPILLRVGNDYTASGITLNFSTSGAYVFFKSNQDASLGSGFSLVFKRRYLSPAIAPQPAITGGGLVYHQDKAALRSGFLSNGVIGTGSIAVGYVAEARGGYSTSMGYSTQASGSYSVAMGNGSQATSLASLALGSNAISSASHAVAMSQNAVSSGYASIAIGNSAEANAAYSTAIGSACLASGNYATAIGGFTQASGESAMALGATTRASGDFATAMGSYASAPSEGSFAIGDHSATSVTVFSTTNRMNMRFANGYRLYTNTPCSVGVGLNAGDNSWNTISDSTKKEHYLPATGNFLQRIQNMKLGSWNYIGQDKKTYRHYGPMAQEFHHYFGSDAIGSIGNDTTIASADIDGVMMIAIQQLSKENTILKSKNEAMEQRLQKLEAMIISLQTPTTDRKVFAKTP